MSRDTTYPLPYQLSTELEMAMENLPDRGNAIYVLRRLAGRIYAEGHEAGRLIGMEEMRRDYHFESGAAAFKKVEAKS